MLQTYFCPSKLIVGEDALQELPELCADLGSRGMLVMDPFFWESETHLRICALLEDKELCVYAKVRPNPRDTDIDEGARLCREQHVDFIIALGGGSAIDSAKAMNVVMCNGGSCWEYTKRAGQGTREILNPLVPLIAIPTTAGTGSEATRYSVITHAHDHSKGTLKSDAIFPSASIIDAKLMVSMPRKTTALTGIDAFAHAFESYIGSQANDFSEMFSLKAMRLFFDHIQTACIHGEDIHARNQMALCSTLGGLAIAHSATTLPHGIGQALSGVTDAPHGGSIAVCMPQVIRWTLPSCEEKFAHVACMMKPSLRSCSIAEQAQQLPELLEQLFHEIIGEPLTMRSYGLNEQGVEAVAKLALSNYKGDVTRHPKVANKEELIAIIQSCL